ncbi:MAG: LysR family transcriptional regulator [Hyphomonadaceae bacterium]|nr:LysR family transcriptional regulator [Hyphomonadaceae bacterium]
MAGPPPLDSIAAFAAVAEKGGFTAAARAMGVGKATVSKQVSALEAQLGVRLFHRTTRSLTLTAEGAQALIRAQRILEEAEGLCDDAAAARESPRGRLKIAAPLSFGVDHLAPALPDFLDRYPELAVDLALDDRRADLVGEGFDIAVRISEMPDSSFVVRKLAPVRLLLVASPAFWAAHGRPKRPEDLAALPSLQYANAAFGDVWRFTNAAAEQVRVRAATRVVINNGAAMIPALATGCGVALLPDMIVWRDILEGRLEPALEDWRAVDNALHLLTTGRNPPRKVRVFQDFMVERFGGDRAPWLALWRARGG